APGRERGGFPEGLQVRRLGRPVPARRHEQHVLDHHGSQLARRRQVLSEEVADAPAPAVSADRVVFSLPDPRRALSCVSLLHELTQPRRMPFTRHGTRWELELARPAADRLEYLLELEDGRGESRLVPDPGNPLEADGPFGPKSVVEFPGYESPAWVGDEESASG